MIDSTGKQRGAQPGHKPSKRVLLPPEKVTRPGFLSGLVRLATDLQSGANSRANWARSAKPGCSSARSTKGPRLSTSIAVPMKQR